MDTYTSDLINPQNGKKILIDGTLYKDTEKGMIEGIVIKGYEAFNNLCPAVNTLVELFEYKKDDNPKPILHTYSDKHGYFFLPVPDVNLAYIVKVFPNTKDLKEEYKPFTSKPIQFLDDKIIILPCCLEKQSKKIINGQIKDRFNHSRKNVLVELYLTIGLNKIPVTRLKSCTTDSKGYFKFSINSQGDYCFKIYI